MSEKPIQPIYKLWRTCLAIEAVRDNEQLVILGDPGSGKSTFVRYLAWIFAQRGLDQISDATILNGWDRETRLLPVIVSFRKLVSHLNQESVNSRGVFDALVEEMRQYDVEYPDILLYDALERDAILILLDGLDEIPVDVADKKTANRITAIQAVRDFSRQYTRARIVVTCRTRAFSNELQLIMGWPTHTLAPFTLGQTRHFIRSWYAEMASLGKLTAAAATRLSEELLVAIVNNSRLRMMAETPLMLTMMALVMYRRGELPRDRPQLYERIVELLLGQWDRVRDGQSLAEAIGLPEWSSERVRPLIDKLAFYAHSSPESGDGRGRIKREYIYVSLIDFFTAAHTPEPWETARRCLDYFEQRSSLLVPDGPDTYAFSSLTLQEHCAGRHIAFNSDDSPALVLAHRADDRWREPIFLSAGLMRPVALNTLLTDLVDREEDNQLKPLERWYRDLILAAEIGADRDWSYLRTRPMIKVDRLQRSLRTGLTEMLTDTRQPLPVAERVRAGFLLGDLGDPRFPISIEEWQSEVKRAFLGEVSGYFCRVEAGTYIVGKNPASGDPNIEQYPQARMTIAEPFWIGRYPITNSQFQFWRQSIARPLRGSLDVHSTKTNQPLTNPNLQDIEEFCRWLSHQIGVMVRLPMMDEWNAVTHGLESMRYPWGENWQEDPATFQTALLYLAQENIPPIGCFPASAAPNGVMDLFGYSRELTLELENYQVYPEKLQTGWEQNISKVFLRGRLESHVSDETYESNQIDPVDRITNLPVTFRIVISNKRVGVFSLREATRDFFEAAGFEMSTSEGDILLFSPKSQRWTRVFNHDVPVYIAPEEVIDADVVVHLHHSASRIASAIISCIFIVVDGVITNDGWLQIATMRSKGTTIIPLDEALLFSGQEEGREGKSLEDHLQTFFSEGEDLYDVTTPVTDRLNFVGREALINELASQLHEGKPLAMFGLRKIGKSSVLYFLRDKLPFPTALVDLQEGFDLKSIYNRIFVSWQNSIKNRYKGFTWNPPFLQDTADPSSIFTYATRDLLQSLERSGFQASLCIMIDESDLIFPYPLIGNPEGVNRYLSFARSIRGLIQERRGQISLLITGVDARLVRQNRIAGQQNPFYKFFREMYLPVLGREDCIQMVRNIGSVMGLSYHGDALGFIADISGGHPFIARQICSLAYQRHGQISEMTLEHIVETANRFIREPGKSDLLDEHGLWGEISDNQLWPQSLIIENQAVLTALADTEPLPESSLLAMAQDSRAREQSLDEMNRRAILDQPADLHYNIRLQLFRQWIRRYKLGKG